MDVVKYIGLYLLKNHQVNIHGLGNLVLRTTPAQHDGEALVPSSIQIELSSSGTIDDNLANFIANNEQLSISKALNALREFSLQAKHDLQEGKEIVVPAVGKFKEVNAKTVFLMNPAFQFTPPNIQALKTGKKLVVDPILGAGFYQPQRPYQAPQPVAQDPFFQQPPHHQEPNYHQAPPQDDYFEPPRKSSINWSRVIVAIVVLLVVVFGAYFLISFLSGNEPHRNRVIMPTPDTTQTTAPVYDTLPQDTSIEALNNTPDGKGITFDVRMFAFSDITNARTKMKELQDKGYTQTFLDQTPDSSFTFVLIPIENASPADTASIMDSLRKLNVLHPNKVGVYRYR